MVASSQGSPSETLRPLRQTYRLPPRLPPRPSPKPVCPTTVASQSTGTVEGSAKRSPFRPPH